MELSLKEKQRLAILSTLGNLNINDCNAEYQLIVLEYIEALDKKIDDITIGEMTAIIALSTAEYND